LASSDGSVSGIAIPLDAGVSPALLLEQPKIQIADYALMSLLTDAETVALARMQWMGKCLTEWLTTGAPPAAKI
jgi:hypothetical protein